MQRQLACSAGFEAEIRIKNAPAAYRANAWRRQKSFRRRSPFIYISQIAFKKSAIVWDYRERLGPASLSVRRREKNVTQRIAYESCARIERKKFGNIIKSRWTHLQRSSILQPCAHIWNLSVFRHSLQQHIDVSLWPVILIQQPVYKHVFRCSTCDSANISPLPFTL